MYNDDDGDAYPDYEVEYEVAIDLDEPTLNAARNARIQHADLWNNSKLAHNNGMSQLSTSLPLKENRKEAAVVTEISGVDRPGMGLAQEEAIAPPKQLPPIMLTKPPPTLQPGPLALRITGAAEEAFHHHGRPPIAAAPSNMHAPIFGASEPIPKIDKLVLPDHNEVCKLAPVAQIQQEFPVANDQVARNSYADSIISISDRTQGRCNSTLSQQTIGHVCHDREVDNQHAPIVTATAAAAALVAPQQSQHAVRRASLSRRYNHRRTFVDGSASCAYTETRSDPTSSLYARGIDYDTSESSAALRKHGLDRSFDAGFEMVDTSLTDGLMMESDGLMKKPLAPDGLMKTLSMTQPAGQTLKREASRSTFRTANPATTASAAAAVATTTLRKFDTVSSPICSKPKKIGPSKWFGSDSSSPIITSLPPITMGPSSNDSGGQKTPYLTDTKLPFTESLHSPPGTSAAASLGDLHDYNYKAVASPVSRAVTFASYPDCASPSTLPRLGTATSFTQDPNDSIDRKMTLSTVSKAALASELADTSAASHQNCVNSLSRLGTVTVVAYDISDQFNRKVAANSVSRTVLTAALTNTSAAFNPDNSNLLPRPGTVTAVAHNPNDQIHRKMAASTVSRTALATAAADTSVASQPDYADSSTLTRPGTMTAVNHDPNDRINRKVAASTVSRTALAAATADAAAFIPDCTDLLTLPHPGTVTAVAHDPKDRINRKVATSAVSRAALTAAAADTSAASHPNCAKSPTQSLPGTMTPVAHDPHDRSYRKSRAAIAPAAAAFHGSDVDVSLQPGTATFMASKSPSSHDRVANKIRASTNRRLVVSAGQNDPSPIMGTAVAALDDRIANKMRRSGVADRSAASASSSDNYIKPAGPPVAGTVTAVAGNYSDRVRASVASRSLSSAESNSTLSDQDPLKPEDLAAVGGTVTNVANIRHDCLSNKVRASLYHEPASAGTELTGSDRSSEQNPSSDRSAGRIRNISQVGVAMIPAGHADRRIFRKIADHEANTNRIGNAKVGARATRGDDPAQAKNTWIQDEVFRDEEGTEFVDVDPEEFFNQRTHEMLTKKEREKLVNLQEKSESKMNSGRIAGFQEIPGAYSSSAAIFFDVGPSPTRKPYKNFSRGNSKRQRGLSKRGLSKAMSRVLTDSTTSTAADDFYLETRWWDELDKATLCVGCIIITLISIAVLTTILLIKNKGAPPTLPPSLHREPSFPQFQAKFEKVSGIEPFQDHNSPQSKALNFIVYQDLLAATLNSPDLVQRYVLMVIFYNNGGDQWRNQSVPWGSGIHECNWDYVDCKYSPRSAQRIRRLDNQDQNSRLVESADGKPQVRNEANHSITGLNFYRAGLTGTLIDELTQLSLLNLLDLAENSLAPSTIPDVIFSLTNLQLLALGRTPFSGPISTAIGALSNLSYLSVFSTQLTGKLPSAMGLLTNLVRFYAYGTGGLGGPLFDFVLQWPQIEEIDVENNDFTGSIPSNINKLSKLEVLTISDNRFLGTLPTELGELPLRKVAISRNIGLINGTIPTELGQLKDLVILLLDSGNLSGTIPTELGNLKLVDQINFEQNTLHGAIPTELGKCTSLVELTLDANQLSGSFPTELGRISGLKTIYLQHNFLRGTVPDQLCALRQHALTEFWTDCELSVVCAKPLCCTGCN